MKSIKLRATIRVTDDGQCCSDGKESCPNYQRDKKISTGHKCALFGCTLHPLIGKGGIPIRCSECVRMQD